METNLISPEPETRAALRLASQVIFSCLMSYIFRCHIFPLTDHSPPGGFKPSPPDDPLLQPDLLSLLACGWHHFIILFIESEAFWAFQQYSQLRVLRKIQVILMVATVKFSLLNYLYKFVLVTILVAVIIIEVMSKCHTFHSSGCCTLYIANLDHSCHHLQSFLPNHLLLFSFPNSLIVFLYCCCCGSLYLCILKVGSFHGVAVLSGLLGFL